MTSVRTIESPIGLIRIEASSLGLTGLRFVDDGLPVAEDTIQDAAAMALLDQVERELHEYFAGVLPRFTVAVAPRGTSFQQRVWTLLQTINRGETRSYIDLARRLDLPGGSRAVGGANGANPIPIIIPCHRVLAADGSLGGFSAGLDRKRWLLRHEGVGVDESLFATAIGNDSSAPG